MKSSNRFSMDVGDVLSRPKFLFVHKGIYLGNGRVLHNTPERGEHISDLGNFANGQPVSVTRIPLKERTTFWHRISATISNPKYYDIATNNCDHTVTRITQGREYSAQLWIAGVFLVITGLALITKR